MVGPDDSADARLTAARHYLATVPVMEGYVEALTRALGQALREEIRTRVAAQADAIETAHVASLVRHLTAAEIEALAVFQASPTGRAIMAKMGALQAELVPSVTLLLQSVAEAAQRLRASRP